MNKNKTFKTFEFIGVIGNENVKIHAEIYNTPQDKSTPTLIVARSNNKEMINRIKHISIYNGKFSTKDCIFIYDNQYTSISDVNLNSIFSASEINELTLQLLNEEELILH